MGRACATVLAGEGCNVALFARRAELLDEAVAQIEALGTGAGALAVAGDATDPAALETLVDRTAERFGKIDILINNTGGPPAGGFEDFDDDGWRAALGLAVMSAPRPAPLAPPPPRQGGRGRVVHITPPAGGG